MPPALRILLLDHQIAAEATRKLLSSVTEFHFDIDHVDAVSQAQTKLRTHQYDAVVSGVRLTEAQGPQTVAALRQAAPEIALLMMSSAEDRDLMSETIAAGADNYLIKDVADGNRIALGILYARQKRSGKVSLSAEFEKFLSELEAQTISKIVSEQISMSCALEEFVKALEAFQNNSYRASILLLEDGKLHLGAAPRLPGDYNEAIEGMTIGAGEGSCGTAAHFRQTIYVVDIESDPLWANFKSLALPHNLRACWSVPIIDSSDILQGTFAMYYDQSRFPSSEEREFIHAAAKTAAKILQQYRSNQT